MEFSLILSLALCCINPISTFRFDEPVENFLNTPELQSILTPEKSDDLKPMPVQINDPRQQASYSTYLGSDPRFSQWLTNLFQTSRVQPQPKPQLVLAFDPSELDDETKVMTGPSSDELSNHLFNGFANNNLESGLPGNQRSSFRMYQSKSVEGPNGKESYRKLTIGEKDGDKIRINTFIQ